MNDDDRNQWIDNDEGLYDLWRKSKMSKRKFIQVHRAMIDQAIQNVCSGKKRQHYLKYE